MKVPQLFLKLIKIMVIIAFLTSLGDQECMAQEQKVNQKKINRDRAKKQKQAEKDYHNAVKRHKKIQSKNTKTMMKQSRKESSAKTPVKR